MQATAPRRGTIMILTLVVFVVLLILGLAYHRVTQGVRRSTVRTYHRLHATTALENALVEGTTLFLSRVNQAGIEYRRPPATGTTSPRTAARRRLAAADGNETAFAAFLTRHGGTVSASVNVATDGSDDTDVVAGGADPWYDEFRRGPASFSAVGVVPYARQLMGRAHDGLTFEELRIRVMHVDEPDPKDRLILARGVIALSATIRVVGDKVSLTRSLERRFRFALQKTRAPSWVGGGEYSRVALERPAVATFLNLHGKDDPCD